MRNQQQEQSKPPTYARTSPDPWLARYLASIERYPILDRSAELELAWRHRQGDGEAAERLITAHLRDVVAIARGYQGYGHNLAELIGEGNLGLVIALDRFEPDRGLRFMTYAGYWVRAEILEFVMAQWNIVGAGKSSLATRLFFGLAREQARLQSHGYDAEQLREELAQRFGCTPARIEQAQQTLAAQDPLRGETDQLPHPDRTPETQLAHAEHQAQIDTALAALDPRERQVVEHRLLTEDRPSLVQLGQQLGISRERVRQIESRARAKLAHDLTDLRA